MAEANYVTVGEIPKWSLVDVTKFPPAVTAKGMVFTPNKDLNDKVSLWKGNIVKLDIDAIQNAANTGLRGGGGIDEAIHKAAGYEELQKECGSLGGCETGQTKITKGYNLKSKYILHTVGPNLQDPLDHTKGLKITRKDEELLKSCYITALELAKTKSLKTIALCNISTNIFKYDITEARHVACAAVRMWLEHESNWKCIDRIIFVMFSDSDLEKYQEVMPSYFPKP
jgi:O-acetyl-ADP-ribose deacetylase